MIRVELPVWTSEENDQLITPNGTGGKFMVHCQITDDPRLLREIASACMEAADFCEKKQRNIVDALPYHDWATATSEAALPEFA